MKKFIIFFAVFLLTTITTYAEATDTKSYLNLGFWEKFNDQNLIENLLLVYANNNDLKATSLKVNQAQTLVRASLANELPHVGFEGYVGQTFKSSDEVFGKLTIPTYTQAHFLLPLTLSYEIDIWGKNRLKTKSQKKNFEMTKQDEKIVYIALTSAFASDYYSLIKTDELIKLQKELIALQEKVVKSVEKKIELGTANINELILEKKNLTYLKEDLDNLLEKQDVLKNQMNVIIADRGFSDIKRNNYEQLNVKILIPESVNSDILSTRPDCKKAELNLERAGIDIKIAKRELLPKINLVGNLGFNAYSLTSANKFLADLGIVPTLDIFAGGRKFSKIKLQKDEYKIATQAYDKAILRAIQETNDTLFALKNTNKKYSIAKDRQNLSDREIYLIERRKNIGTADSLAVLAQREVQILTKKQEVSLKIDEIIAAINFYQALGGVDFLGTSL